MTALFSRGVPGVKQRAAAPLELELLLPPLPLGLGIFATAFPTRQPSHSLTEWSSASRFGDLVWSAQNGTSMWARKVQPSPSPLGDQSQSIHGGQACVRACCWSQAMELPGWGPTSCSPTTGCPQVLQVVTPGKEYGSNSQYAGKLAQTPRKLK